MTRQVSSGHPVRDGTLTAFDPCSSRQLTFHVGRGKFTSEVSYPYP